MNRMECHITDMDDEPPEEIELDEDDEYERVRQEEIDEARNRRIVADIHADLEHIARWPLARRQV